MKVQDQIANATKVHVDWVRQNAERLVLRTEREFMKYLGRDGFGGLRVNASSLGTLATVASTRFIADVGHSSSLLDQSLSLLATQSQLAVSVFMKDAQFSPRFVVPTSEMDELPLLISASFLRNLPNTHRQLVLLQRHLLDLNKSMLAIKQRFNVSEPFRFIYELECSNDDIAPNSKLTDARETLGPYWPLLLWQTSDAESFSRDLHAAADHRMSLISTDDPDRIAPIDYVPFDLFPVELLYVIELRKRAGLPLSEITHPLLTPWLHFEYAQGPLPTDEWVEKVRAKCKDYGIDIVLD